MLKPTHVNKWSSLTLYTEYPLKIHRFQCLHMDLRVASPLRCATVTSRLLYDASFPGVERKTGVDLVVIPWIRFLAGEAYYKRLTTLGKNGPRGRTSTWWSAKAWKIALCDVG